MKGSNVIEILKTFSKEEMKEFRDFVRSPYHNKRKAVEQLFELIQKHYPEFDSLNLSKEKIFQKLFPGKKYNDSTLRVLSHYLSELAENFIAHSMLSKNPFEYSMALRKNLYDKKLYKLVEKSILNSEKELDSISIDAEDFYFNKYRLENDRVFYWFSSNYASYDKSVINSDWEDVYKQLNNFYLIKVLTMYLNTLGKHRIYNSDFHSKKFKQSFYEINKNELEDIPAAKIFYCLIKMFLEFSDESNFYKAKELLKKYKSVLNSYDRIGAYVNLNTYCIQKITEGISKFEEERFAIYQDELEEKSFYLGDGTISPIFFRNVVLAGLSLNKLDWTRNFILKYKGELNKKYRNNYFNLCMALYEFASGNFETALELNSKIVYDELYIKLYSKVLQLQIYFELGIYDTLSDSIESFRQFLHNDKLIPEVRKKQFTNFHKFLKQILILKSGKNNFEIDIQEMKLHDEKDVINKSWLLKKVREMK